MGEKGNLEPASAALSTASSAASAAGDSTTLVARSTEVVTTAVTAVVGTPDDILDIVRDKTVGAVTDRAIEETMNRATGDKDEPDENQPKG